MDDGSPDSSGRIADEYAAKDSRIRVIHQKNNGVAAARNAGVRISVGEYATFVDGDDFLHPDFLRDVIAIARRTDSDIVQCQYVRGKATSFPAVPLKERVHTYAVDEAFLSDTVKIIVCGKLYKTEILKAIAIPEGHYFEDDFVTWRWYYAANRIAVTNLPYYYYTCNDESQMAQHKKRPNISFIEIYDERRDFFKDTGESELEACTLRQLCKSLLLIYGSPLLTSDQRSRVWSKFNESWKVLKHSGILTAKWRLLFGSFALMPHAVLALLQKVR